ncbi:MAG: hypothetical protein ACI31S_01425 [Bacilli bacterium]
MENYLKLVKYRKQLEYIDKIFKILQDENDGNLYNCLTYEEIYKFDNFMDFLTNVQINTEKKLKEVTNKLLKIA